MWPCVWTNFGLVEAQPVFFSTSKHSYVDFASNILFLLTPLQKTISYVVKQNPPGSYREWCGSPVVFCFPRFSKQSRLHVRNSAGLRKAQMVADLFREQIEQELEDPLVLRWLTDRKPLFFSTKKCWRVQLKHLRVIF